MDLENNLKAKFNAAAGTISCCAAVVSGIALDFLIFTPVGLVVGVALGVVAAGGAIISTIGLATDLKKRCPGSRRYSDFG